MIKDGFCSGSGGGVLGRLRGRTGDVSGTGGQRSALGVGWVVTEEDGDLQGVAGTSSTLASPEEQQKMFNLVTQGQY